MNILLKLSHAFDYYVFILRFLLNKSLFLHSRVMVAYGCLFSDLRYNCNTCTEVVIYSIMLILSSKINILILFVVVRERTAFNI